MGEAPEVFYVNNSSNGFTKFGHETDQNFTHHNHDSSTSWFEEVIDHHLKWSFALNRFLFVSSLSISFLNPYICLYVYWIPLLSQWISVVSFTKGSASTRKLHSWTLSTSARFKLRSHTHNNSLFNFTSIIKHYSLNEFSCAHRLWWLMERCRVLNQMSSYITNAWFIQLSYVIPSKFSFSILEWYYNTKSNHTYRVSSD